MKIRTKITLSLIIGFSVILVALGWIIGDISSKQLVNLNELSVINVNNAKAHEASTFLKGEMEVISSLSASTVFREFLSTPENSSQYGVQRDRTAQRLVRSIGSVPQIEELFILNKNGKVVVSTDFSQEGKDKLNDPYFIEGKKGVYIKSFYFSETTNTNVYAVSAPINDDTSKELLGVIVARMNPQNLYNATGSGIEGTKTGEVFLLDSNYFVISPGVLFPKEDILKRKVETQNAKDCFAPEEIKATIAGNNKATLNKNYVDYRGVNIVGTHHYIPEAGWCLITKEDKNEVLGPSYFLLTIYLIFSVISIIITFPASYFLSSQITKNIVILQNRVELIDSGNLDRVAIINSKDEIGKLSKSFEKMVESVKKSREDVDRKVKEQTKEIIEKQQSVEDQQKATLNILEDVEEEKTKTAALLAGIGEGVFATDVNTNIIYINKTAEDFIGWKAEEVLGKSLYNFLKMFDEKDKPVPEEQRPFHIALELGKSVIGTMQKSYYYERRNGEKFPVSISVTPVLINGKIIGAINVFRDITHEKAVDKAKTEFVSLASHQLRTPLSAINWYTEMLLAGDAGKITSEQKKYLEEVYRSNKRMVDLVNSLLNVSRIDLGTFAIVPEPCNISEVAKSVLLELTPMIKTKKMKIEETYDKSLKNINVDLKLIRIIFQNLLSNAVKYTPNEGKISVSIVKQDKDALIKVQDTGYGILKKDQSRIFEKLFRADNIREKETDGTGLGLYIIKSILEQSGGKIWFESSDDQKNSPGTTFFVTIPLTGMKQKEGTKDIS